MASENEIPEERLALKVREAAGVADRYCCDMLFVLNELQQKGLIRWRIVPDAGPLKEASYDSDSKTISLPEEQFRKLDHPFKFEKSSRRRARFSVAHELGHWAWGHDGLHYRGSINRQAISLRSKVSVNEAQANRIAAAILIPADLAKNCALDAEKISDLFDVNIAVAGYRIPDLERMERRATGQLRPLPASVTRLLKDAEKHGVKSASLRADEEYKRKLAVRQGYAVTACAHCGNFTLAMKDNMLKCDTCSKTA